MKPETHERRAGENVDLTQWKNTVVLAKGEEEFFPGTRVRGYMSGHGQFDLQPHSQAPFPGLYCLWYAVASICRQHSLVLRRLKNRRERLVHTVRACTKSPW